MEDVRRWFVEFITSPTFATLYLAGSIWLFKAAVGRALDKRVESHKLEGQRQTEQLKSEWQQHTERLKAEWQVQGQQHTEQVKAVLQLEVQRDVERLKADLLLRGQHQLEQLRAELNARNEAIRHEMQKQFLRAQLVTTKAQEVYSELFGRLLRAEGAIGGLWGMKWVPNYRTYSTEQLAELIKEARPGGEEEKRILAILERSKEEGIKRIEEVLRRRELEEAKRQHTEARNYLIIERLFVSKRVRELTEQVLRELWSAWTSVHVGEQDRGTGTWMEQYNKALEVVAKTIDELEEAMRTDLQPGLVGSVPIAPPDRGAQ